MKTGDRFEAANRRTGFWRWAIALGATAGVAGGVAVVRQHGISGGSALTTGLFVTAAAQEEEAGERRAASVMGEQELVAIDSALLQYDEDLKEGTTREGVVTRNFGQTVEREVELPARPMTAAAMRRILLVVEVQPIEEGSTGRPGDPWTRLGNVTVLVPGVTKDAMREVELTRFVTGFGSAGRFVQDVTSLMPVLHGTRTLRLSLGTWVKTGWRATVKLQYSPEGVGVRRPALVDALFYDWKGLSAEKPVIRGFVQMPEGVAMPRLRVLTTGHATDGMGGDEFITRTHILRVDGREVARWRPWSELGGMTREANPYAGRDTVDGREIWSSDLDRSGWVPGRAVRPLMLPVPELTTGRHLVELEIEGIRPRDERGKYGFWPVSVVVVADEPWGEVTMPAEEGR